VDFCTIGEILKIAEKTASFDAWVGRNQMRAVLAREWWEEDGYSARQIAEKLNLKNVTKVSHFVHEGHRYIDQQEGEEARQRHIRGPKAVAPN
jgi:hypothetical protein